MKKKPIFTFLSSSLIVFGLTSCVFFNYGNDNPGANFSYKNPTYDSSYSSSNMNKDYLGRTIGQYFLPSTGQSSILVIPVQFQNDKFSEYELETLENTFFGEDYETGWESVSSFYKKSSSNQLQITGQVIDPVTVNSTYYAFEREASNYKGTGTYTDELLDSILSQLILKDAIDLSLFDSNGDHIVDSIWLVYSCSFDAESDLYWAYTTWSSISRNYNNYYVNPYSWASIDFLYEGNYNNYDKTITDKGDGHTFIHETGHLLGLDDYYSYDYNGVTNYDTPVGGVDMMDFNIGDHCSFSKYLLDWVEPTIITQEYLEANNYVLNLTSFEDTNKFFLIPSVSNGELNYNDTVLDEYLLVEFYTPTNLNEQDSKQKYTNGLSTYSKPGVLVYHVNASVGRIYVSAFSSSVEWDGYLFDKLPPESQVGLDEGYYYIFSNTQSYGYYQMDDSESSFYRGRLISLLPAVGYKIEGKKTGYSGNACLFQKGDKAFIDGGVFTNFIFDDGTKPQYGFEVTGMTSSACTLRFEAL